MSRQAEKREPMYVQMQDIIVKKIEAGEYLAGERLASERELAVTYDINRMTVKNAVNGLVEKGYLYRVQGKGTFVQKTDFNKLDLGFLNESGNQGITAMVNSHGVQISNEVLGKGIQDNPRFQFFNKRLNLGLDEKVYGLHRIRFGNNEPIAVEYTYVPMKFFPDIDSLDFKYVSLYDYMNSKHHMPIAFTQRFQFIEIAEKEAKYLGLEQGEPVYYFEFIGTDRSGKVVEYTESYTRVDKAEFRFQAHA